MSRRHRRRAWRRGSEWLYRALLWLYPPSLRRAYGDDMLQLFRDTLRDEVARAGPPGALRAWEVALADLAASLPREWPHELRRLRPRRVLFQRIASGVVVYGPSQGSERRMYMHNFERFTERARRVMSLAQEEAQRFHHNYIGTEHILLGLVAEGDGVAAKVLANLGVELDKARNAVEFIIGRGDRVTLGEIGMTPRSKKVIELAIDEARRLNHHYVGTEHLLLGLVREGEGIAAGVLESLGVNLERARSQTLQVLGGSPMGGAAWTAGATQRSRPDLGKFTERARKVIAVAITEAREREQREVSTGHALLALLDDQGAAWLLRTAGLSLDAARHALAHDIGPRMRTGDQPAKGPIDLDAHTLRMIALAADEASQMNDRFVSPEHLLLGLLREGEGVGAQVLLRLAADVDQLRAISLQRASEVGGALDRRPALGQITLLCRDVTATGAFYLESFGAAPVSGSAGAGESPTLRLPGGGPLLALRATPADATLTGAAIELDIWVGDVDLHWRTLKDSDATDLSPLSDAPDGRAFTLPDPDGRLLRVRAYGDQGGEAPAMPN